MPVLKEGECFSATSALWTSAATEPHKMLTDDFIDKTWNLQPPCLDTVQVFADHIGQNIVDAIMDIFDNWQVSTNKSVAVTTDGGSNIVAAFNTQSFAK